MSAMFLCLPLSRQGWLASNSLSSTVQQGFENVGCMTFRPASVIIHSIVWLRLPQSAARGRSQGKARIATRSADAYNRCMAIESTTFGRVELSGKEAERFQRHMTEDKPNLAAKASLARGQAMLARIASARQAKTNGKR